MMACWVAVKWPRAVVLATVSAAVGSPVACTPKVPSESTVAPSVAQATKTQMPDPMAVRDELEGLIASGKDTEEDRRFAHDRVRNMQDDGSVEYAFARAALAGRLAEARGAGAGKLVTEAETWARKAIERDAEFRGGEPRRMLGSLYVMAPGRLVEHGDSEDGLSMLEALVEQHPQDPRNHFRLAEAYVFIGDPEPAYPHLCEALKVEQDLRPDEQRVLGALIEEVGGADALGCQQEAS